MANYKHPIEKASETVTFRLTMADRRLFDHLAEVDGSTLTELFRSLLARRAAELGIDEAPTPIPRRRPGRPRTRPTGSGSDVPSRTSIAQLDDMALGADSTANPTFGDLVERFQVHFADRGQSTRAELADTINLVTDDSASVALIDRDTALVDIDSARLDRVREWLKGLELRVAQKNLHLTYLRMLFVFATKEPDIRIEAVPDRDLAPLTARETGATWSVPPPPPEASR